MKITIEKISRKEQTSRDGRPYTSVGIHIDGEWWNGFEDAINAQWRKGDSVHVDLTRNGDFRNFKTLNPIQILESRIEAIEKKLGITLEAFDKDADDDIKF